MLSVQIHNFTSRFYYSHFVCIVRLLAQFFYISLLLSGDWQLYCFLLWGGRCCCWCGSSFLLLSSFLKFQCFLSLLVDPLFLSSPHSFFSFFPLFLHLGFDLLLLLLKFLQSLPYSLLPLFNFLDLILILVFHLLESIFLRLSIWLLHFPFLLCFLLSSWCLNFLALLLFNQTMLVFDQIALILYQTILFLLEFLNILQVLVDLQDPSFFLCFLLSQFMFALFNLCFQDADDLFYIGSSLRGSNSVSISLLALSDFALSPLYDSFYGYYSVLKLTLFLFLLSQSDQFVMFLNTIDLKRFFHVQRLFTFKDLLSIIVSA